MKKYSRTSPYLSYIKSRERLSKEGSTKKTYHIVLDITGWEESYRVGDSVGILPINHCKEVDRVLKASRLTGEEILVDKRTKEEVSFRQFLTSRANLMQVNRALYTLAEGEKHLPFEGCTMADLLRFSTLSAQEIADGAMPLLPRFYSIANSDKMFPGELHLLVAYVEYQFQGQVRLGVGSHFLCDSAIVGDTLVPIYIQPSQHFTTPQSSATSMIMIGPGTGVAPYRAFIQERLALQAPGKHWLFFGERNRSSDFYYEEYWTSLEKQGRLRLDAAFSRDGEAKVYVHHKLYEHRKEIWDWISTGAHLYVCGDASKMAKDVDAVLYQIVKEEGNLSEIEAKQYIKAMRQERRYLLDVY